MEMSRLKQFTGKLNGWQRLWVVAAAIWMMVVSMSMYVLSDWPTSSRVSKAEVYQHLQSRDGDNISDFDPYAFPSDIPLESPLARFESDSNVPTPPPKGVYLVVYFDEVAARQAGYTNRQIAEYLARSRGHHDKEDLMAGIPDSSLPSLISTWFLEPVKSGPSVDVAQGHTIPFVWGLSQTQVDATSHAYASQLHRLLFKKRLDYAGVAVVGWAVPASLLYLLGWSVAWIRHGFTRATSS